MVRIPKYREPTHPGEMLMEEFLIPMSITQRDLSKAIHVPYQWINEIVALIIVSTSEKFTREGSGLRY